MYREISFQILFCTNKYGKAGCFYKGGNIIICNLVFVKLSTIPPHLPMDQTVDKLKTSSTFFLVQLGKESRAGHRQKYQLVKLDFYQESFDKNAFMF